MTTTPTGLLATPLHAMQAMLAQCQSFQTWTGSADATAALARAHIIEPDDGTVNHPFAVLAWDNASWASVGAGAGLQFQPKGEIRILLEAATDPADANLSQEPAWKFSNTVGAIIAELLDQAGTSGQLYVTNLALEENPSRVSESYLGTAGDFFQARLTARWGLE